MRNNIMPVIYDNFDVFHTMCLSATLLCTYDCRDGDSDAHDVITFIGNAYKLPREAVEDFEACILGPMMNIGLITDYHALASVEFLSDEDKENIELYEIKGKVLEEISIAESLNYTITDMRLANQIKSTMKYEFFHHPYNSKFRFWQLRRLSENGNISVIRELGILYTLGIGCDTDYKKAEKCFLKCILWGDKVSSILLTALYDLSGNTDAVFYGINGIENDISDNNAISEYKELIKFLKAFIIAPKKDYLINNELADILISNELPHSRKVELVVNFNEKTWHNAVCHNSQNNTIGFKVKKNE